MRTSSSRFGSVGLLLVLLAANTALYAVWPWLRGGSFGAVTSESPLNDTDEAYKALNPPAILHNFRYASWLFDRIKQQHGVLFFGTSESIHDYNLGAQINEWRPDDPPMTVLAQGGMSAIHSVMAFSVWEHHDVVPPPLLFVVNPVYFTRSHDVIDEGWLSKVVPSPLFLFLNHDGIRQNLSPEVRTIYDRHFWRRNWLYPVQVQEYLGNLLYLRFHQAGPGALEGLRPPLERYNRHGEMPEYDERNVHAGNRASDEMAQWRWEVNTTDESLNLKGLHNIVSILERQNVPVLLLFLPANRVFYRLHGLDMDEFERRYAAIRADIQGLADPGRVFVLDAFDISLHQGFEDRMHLDEYGYEQMVQLLGEEAPYGAFLETVRERYAREAPAGP